MYSESSNSESRKRSFKKLEEYDSNSSRSDSKKKTSIEKYGYYAYYAQIPKEERDGIIDGFLANTQKLTEKSNGKLIKQLEKEGHNKYYNKLDSIENIRRVLSLLKSSYNNKNIEDAKKYEEDFMQLTEQSDYKSLRSLWETYKDKSSTSQENKHIDTNRRNQQKEDKNQIDVTHPRESSNQTHDIKAINNIRDLAHAFASMWTRELQVDETLDQYKTKVDSMMTRVCSYIHTMPNRTSKQTNTDFNKALLEALPGSKNVNKRAAIQKRFKTEVSRPPD